MIKFVRNLTKTKLVSKNDAEIYFLSECIHTLVTKDKSQLKTAFSSLLHGLTRSRERINVASDLGIGIPYHNVLYLHECWALDEFKKQPVCPAEIAEGKASKVITDNDDFKGDDLTGGTTLHRTNMMFVQPKKWIRKVFQKLHKAVVNVREKLNQIVTVENQILSYQSAVRGEPQSFESINISRGTTDLMKKKFVTQVFLRIRKGDDILPNEQDIGEFTVFMALVFPKEYKSKPYDFTALPKLPTKPTTYINGKGRNCCSIQKYVFYLVCWRPASLRSHF